MNKMDSLFKILPFSTQITYSRRVSIDEHTCNTPVLIWDKAAFNLLLLPYLRDQDFQSHS